MFMIETNLSTYDSYFWVLDIKCESHICNNVQELIKTKLWQKDEMDIWIGNSVRVAILAGGTCSFSLTICWVHELENCYFVSILTRNIISISCLVTNGFKFIIEGKMLFLCNNNVFYGWYLNK